MAILTLTKLWLTRLDSGESIVAQTGRSDRSQQYARQLEVREYASGRLRSFSSVGLRGQVSWRLVDVTQANKDRMGLWAGLLLQARDYRGQKFFGVYDAIDVEEFPELGLYSVGITLRTVSYTEGV
jgi:hypothetical protein